MQKDGHERVPGSAPLSEVLYPGLLTINVLCNQRQGRNSIIRLLINQNGKARLGHGPEDDGGIQSIEINILTSLDLSDDRRWYGRKCT